jgi:hypothetical protein
VSCALTLVFQVDSIVAAEYELEYLLLEGHCYDITTGQPPRGLQFTLGTSANPTIVDTIVMANLVSNQFIDSTTSVMVI